MKILYVTNSMAIGGIETNLVGLTARLRASGDSVTVLSTGGVLVSELERNQVSHIHAMVSLRHPAGLLRTTLAFPRILKRVQPDVVHTMSAAGQLVTTLAARSGRTVFVASPMGLQMSANESAVATLLRNAALLLRAEHVFLISSEIRREVERLRFGRHQLWDQDLIGVDPARFAPADPMSARAGLGISPEAFVVTTIGALHPRKSHELFVRAASSVLAELPHAQFLIVGEGPERAHLERVIHELGLSASVRLLGPRRDVAEILAATDVYVKPGVVEGFIGITVLEAMLSERPVVAFDTVDVRAAIKHEQTGLLVERGDTTGLARAITRLSADRGLAATLAGQGRLLAKERYSLDEIARRLRAQYSTIIRQRAR